MEKSGINILYVGTNEDILNVVVNLIGKNEGQFGYGAGNLRRAFELGSKIDFDLVLIGGGLSEVEETELITVLNEMNPNSIFVQHYGGGSGLLKSEINMALEMKAMKV